MTATEIIAEIQALSPQEKEQVLQFVRSLDFGTRLSGNELSVLAEKLAQCEGEVEAAELRTALTKGFYAA